MNTQNLSTVQVFQSFSHKLKKSFPSVLPKRVYLVSLRMHNKSAQRKPVKNKETSRGKISKGVSSIISKTYNLEEKKGNLASEKGLQLIEVFTTPVNNHLS